MRKPLRTKNEVYRELGLLLGYSIKPSARLKMNFERSCIFAELGDINHYPNASNAKKLTVENFFFNLYGFDLSSSTEGFFDLSRLGDNFIVED